MIRFLIRNLINRNEIVNIDWKGMKYEWNDRHRKCPAIGKFGVTIQLGTTVQSCHQANLSPEQIDTVIFGNVLLAGLGQKSARQVEDSAGLNHASTAVTVNEVCGSGLKAIIVQPLTIRLGSAVISRRYENMSLAAFITTTLCSEMAWY